MWFKSINIIVFITYRGWCKNISLNDDDDDFNNSSYPPTNSNGTCIDIGYCGIGIIYGENCNYVVMSYLMLFSKSLCWH